jgi:hypothetical protein
MIKKNKKSNRGFAAILVLVVLMCLILIVTFSLSAIIITKNKTSKNVILSAQSYYSAESGIEDGILRIIKGYNYTAINNFDLDDSNVNQNITQSGGITTIESLSSYFNNERKVKTELALTIDDISFYYGVQVGEGGLTMGNGSFIIGNLYSDGSVSGGGTIAGDLIVATGMSLDANGLWDNYSDEFRFGKNGEPIDIAMSFTPASTAALSQVSLYVKKVSNPPDGTIRIVSNNAGSPSTTVLATTNFLSSKIGLSYGWVDFSFSAPAVLAGGVIYWIIIDVASSNSKYFYTGRKSGNANSVSKHSSDWSAGSWTIDAAGDYEYKAWVGGLATSVNGITIEGNVRAHEIINSAISGDAYYQTISGSSVSGDSYPGSPDSPIEALPISDSNIADWKADAESYGILNSSICSQPVDIVINGGVLECDFSPAAGITITLNGTLWVKGNITLNNNTKLKLGSGYGTNSGVIIADDPGSELTDGKILVNNNVVICGSQGINGASCFPSNGTYILMLSTHSGAATFAIDVRNNANGAIFYAHKGTANVNNNASLKEVTAYKLNLANNATVTYESGLANASFSSGPGGGWIISNWNEIE